jgi:23S rRNA (uridine2552-2'-O)-methyltransferase
VEMLKLMRTLFVKVKPFKPKACRDDSFEIYLVGMDKLETESTPCES